MDDRATVLNLMKGLNGYTLCSGIICRPLNGSEYTTIPLAEGGVMHIGYVQRWGSPLSRLGELVSVRGAQVHPSVETGIFCLRPWAGTLL